MKFITSTASLLRLLQSVSPVIPTRTVLPILEYILFEIEEGLLTVTASDLEVNIRSTMKVEARESGRIAIPAKLLIDFLKTLPEQPATFSMDIARRTLEVTSDNGKYRFAAEEADAFPKFPVIENGTTTTLPAMVLAEAINTTDFSIGTDDMRPAMTGLLMQLSPEELRFVATDGNRLVLYRRTDASAEKEESMILPRKALSVLKAALPTDDEPIDMEYHRLNARFRFKDTELICRLIDERFPDYRAAIPSESPRKLRVGRTELMGALRRIDVFANKSTHQARFSIKGGEITLSAQDNDYSNDGTEHLRGEYDGPDMDIAFNAKYLLEMAAGMGGDEVELHMSEYNRPAILRPGESKDGQEVLMLIMPIVINM